MSNLQDLLELAKWSDWIILKWREVVTPAMASLIEVFGVRLDDSSNQMIAMAVFVSMIAIGSRFENFTSGSTGEVWPVRLSNILNFHMLAALIIYSLHAALILSAGHVPWVTDTYLAFPNLFWLAALGLYSLAIVIGLKDWPLWASIVVTLSMIGFSYVFGNSAHNDWQPNVSETASFAIAFLAVVACGLTVVGLAPPISFTKRIIFMIVGVIGIAGLSNVNRLADSIFS